MKLNQIIIGLLVLIVLTGCIVQYKCSDGTVVNKLSDCINPTTQINYQQTTEKQETPTVQKVIGHSRSNPARINTRLTTSFWAAGETVDAEVTLIDLRRGDVAWSLIKEASQFNSAPEGNQEYLLAKFRFKILNISGDMAYTLSYYYFDVTSSNGVVYPKLPLSAKQMFVTAPDELSGGLYSGATKEGWIAFMIDKSDTAPLISFNRNIYGAGQDELWFSIN